MRSNRQSERGEGQLGCIFGVVLLLLAILLAYKMIPVKVKAADLRATVVDEAKSAGMHSDAVIMQAILQKAKSNDLPVTEDDVKINRKQGSITVEVEYTVPVQFPGYTYNWHFRHYADNPIF
jgi:regulatory protein YycI of two-component signal transduction system YycFG